MSKQVQSVVLQSDEASRRHAQRYALHLPSSGNAADARFDACIRSISTGGMAIEASLELQVGSRIEIDLPGNGRTAATVVWSDGMIGGCAFDAPLPRAVISATRLKGYPQVAEPAAGAPAAVLLEPKDPRWPGAVRMGILGGGAVAAWALVAFAIVQLG